MTERALLLPFICSANSNAGNKSDQNEAAVMTPAAKPRLASRNDRFTTTKTKIINKI